MAKATTLTKSPLVAKRIKERREELGFSQREISQPGTTYAYVSRIESNQRTPSIEALVQLAEVLHTTALALLTGRPEGRCPVCKRIG